MTWAIAKGTQPVICHIREKKKGRKGERGKRRKEDRGRERNNGKAPLWSHFLWGRFEGN